MKIVSRWDADRVLLDRPELTNLTGANLKGANLTRANLKGARMPSPENPNSLVDAARRVKDWLSAGRWIQGKWIATPHGAYAGDCQACLHGAAVYVGGDFGPELSRKLCDSGFTVDWNDESGRSIDEVLHALDTISEQSPV